MSIAGKTAQVILPNWAVERLKDIRAPKSFRGPLSERPFSGLDPFISDAWIKHTQDKIVNGSGSSATHKQLLAAFIGILKNPVIVDFGGGMGELYNDIVSGDVQYFVIDDPILSEKGRELVPGPIFTNTFPYKPDIVFMSSVLQYVEHWEETLNTIFGYLPKSFLMARHYTANKLIYAEQEIVTPKYGYCGKAPVCFIPVEMIRAIATRHGYRMVVNTVTDRNRVFGASLDEALDVRETFLMFLPT